MKFFFSKRSKAAAAVPVLTPNNDTLAGTGEIDRETAAVIALAIQLYINQAREFENSIITIQKIMKPYSPWSSKIYGLRQVHHHTPALKPR